MTSGHDVDVPRLTAWTMSHSFEVNLAVAIQQAKPIFEQRRFRFVEITAGSPDFLAVFDEVFSDSPHAYSLN